MRDSPDPSLRSAVEGGIAKVAGHGLAMELVDAYAEVKRNYQLGGHRLGGVEGGRFCEAAFRILQQVATGAHDPLGRPLDIDKVTRHLANLPRGSQPDSIRVHIPRALRVIYDIRSNRNVAHLGDGIDPNLQDATVVAAVSDWVLAELIRLFHNVSPAEAQSMITEVVSRAIPVVEEFDGFVKILRPELGASDYSLAIAFYKGSTGVTYPEFDRWVRPKMRSNLRRTLRALVDDRAFLHYDGTRYRITRAGIAEVEKRQLARG